MNTHAHAYKISEEWRNFRTYPRTERAYALLKKGDLAGARNLFEQVYQINPKRKDISFELARICARQADIACIDAIAQKWISRQPEDATGYMLKGYIGYLTKNESQIIKYAPLALQRPGAPETFRSSLAEAWVAALINSDDATAIKQAEQLLKTQKISIAGDKLVQWEQHRQSAQQASQGKQPITKQFQQEGEDKTGTAPSELSKQVATQAARQNRNPAQSTYTKSKGISPQSLPAKTKEPIPQFPYAELNQAERNNQLSVHLIALAEQQQNAVFLNKVSRLQSDHLFNPALQASLARGLQTQHCDLLLAITPIETNAKLTTPYSQMAAAFCSKNNPRRAAGHFAAVNQLRSQNNQSPDLIALRGEGDALMADGQTEQAMQRWYQLLQIEPQAQLGETLAAYALHNPQFTISHSIANRFPQYFPAGSLALQQARHAVNNGDYNNAVQLFSRSLTENPDADIWYELSLLHKKNQQSAKQGEALAMAIKLAPQNALFHAEYGFWLINAQDNVAALENLQEAIRLEPTRIELQPQIAFLHMQQGNREAAIIDLRASIDQHAAIQAKMGISGDAATQQLFNWQRNVQTLEDRWNWLVNTQIRLNTAPDTSSATSPVQYGQYNGYINTALTYRLDPIRDAARPTWIFVRANQGLNDQSLSFTPDKTLGLGVTQRLLKDYMVIGSAEWLYRTEATYKNDMMVRLSGSHSINTDWQPTGNNWLTFNLYGDAAWLVRAESYYLTTSVEAGQQYRLPWLDGKSTLMPFISSIATANNDNPTHTIVSRVDVGVGLALQTWHGADPWRAPDLRQRLSLEVRQAIGGNTDDDFAVLLRWGLFH
ncbi:tetratricopeptide repeat protein [Deefgea sp. CFH1-16]|nr:tetratricopeptide repeat protein [Deefgea sp. CFH1-16]